MSFRQVSLKLKRHYERGQRQAEAQINRHVFGRFARLYKVRRFVTIWIFVLLACILAVSLQTYMANDYFERLVPVSGGIYNEGVLGTFTTANPIYATNDVDTTLSTLIFAGLLKYNQDNKLVGDLASSYSVNSKGDTYTFNLKPNLVWQDGLPITSKDVVFTINLIENPDAQSPYFSDWQGIKVSAPNPQTVVFNLPDPLASFPRQLTTGILPEHLLNSVPPDEMRSANFNTEDPVGSGPFKWESINVNGDTPQNAQEEIELIPFPNYALGKAKLAAFVIHAYADQDQLVAEFNKGALNGAEGLTQVPSGINKKTAQAHSLIFTAGVYVFFKTSVGILANQAARSALIQSVNQQQIISSLGYQTYPINEPLLQGMLGYSPQYQQPGYNLAAAKQTLSSGGWSDPNGQWILNGQPLAFTLTVANTPEYLKVANELIDYWNKLGANVTLQVLDSNNFSQAIDTHTYNSILYAIAIGTDPDVFVYWDSAQASITSPDPLNLSEFSNQNADESLQEGRTRIDPALRIIKYQGFLQAWQSALPALGLYQPRLLYLTNGPVYGLGTSQINSNSDRLDNVVNWEINEGRVVDK